MDLFGVSRPSSRVFWRSHPPIAIVALFGIVAFVALGVVPLFLLSLCAVALVLAMLAISAALEHSGAVHLILSLAASQLKGLPPNMII